MNRAKISFITHHALGHPPPRTRARPSRGYALDASAFVHVRYSPSPKGWRRSLLSVFPCLATSVFHLLDLESLSVFPYFSYARIFASFPLATGKDGSKDVVIPLLFG